VKDLKVNGYMYVLVIDTSTSHALCGLKFWQESQEPILYMVVGELVTSFHM
jgi:hypothetical protein